MRTLDAVFAQLSDPPAQDDIIYTTLAPLYQVMYVARNRIAGQLETVVDVASEDTSTVLELGCGTGHLLAELASSFEVAIGADPSPAMARLASDRAAYVCQADAHAVQSNSVDMAVLLGAVLGHIRPDAATHDAISQVKRVLRPGGQVVCSVHRHLDEPRSRELTRSVDGYELTQRDEQRPVDDSTFEWQVRFDMTDEATGETRSVSTVESLRAFTPAELEAWFVDAGFASVSTRPRKYVDGPGESDRAFVLTGRCQPTDERHRS